MQNINCILFNCNEQKGKLNLKIYMSFSVVSNYQISSNKYKESLIQPLHRNLVNLLHKNKRKLK